MAAIVSRLSVGNQAQRIARAFSTQTLEGTTSVPKGHDHPGGLTGLRAHFASKGMGQVWWQDLINQGMDLVKTRFQYGPGTVVQETPQGTIYYQQPEGNQPSLPVVPGPLSTQQYGVAAPEGFSTGMAIALGVGVVALVLVTRKR